MGSLPEDIATQFFFWAGVDDVQIELFGGFPTNPNAFSQAELTRFILGMADEIDVDPMANTVTIHGRDLSAPLIDLKTTEKFQNQTASEIAQTLAQRNGLLAAVTPTSILSGTYYKQDHVNLSSDRSQWDLLTYLR